MMPSKQSVFPHDKDIPRKCLRAGLKTNIFHLYSSPSYSDDVKGGGGVNTFPRSLRIDENAMPINCQLVGSWGSERVDQGLRWSAMTRRTRSPMRFFARANTTQQHALKYQTVPATVIQLGHSIIIIDSQNLNMVYNVMRPC